MLTLQLNNKLTLLELLQYYSINYQQKMKIVEEIQNPSNFKWIVFL